MPGLTVLAYARHADSARDMALRILLRLALDAGDWDAVRGRLGDERRFVRNNAISYLGDHAGEYDLTPLLEAIVEHLSARVNWARWGAQKALTTYVGESAERARRVFDLIDGRRSEHAVELRAYCQSRLE